MVYALGWIGVLLLLAIWSLTAWAAHSFTAWTVASVGGLAAGSEVTQRPGVPDWLAPWVPPELAAVLDSIASAVAPAVEAVLAWAPALEGGLSVAVWVIWGIGSFLLIVAGMLVTGVVAALRRRPSLHATRSGAPAAAR